MIQQAIAQILTPIFDPHFSESSFGFRPGCSGHGALKQVQSYLKADYRNAVDLDLAAGVSSGRQSSIWIY